MVESMLNSANYSRLTILELFKNCYWYSIDCLDLINKYNYLGFSPQIIELSLVFCHVYSKSCEIFLNKSKGIFFK